MQSETREKPVPNTDAVKAGGEDRIIAALEAIGRATNSRLDQIQADVRALGEVGQENAKLAGRLEERLKHAEELSHDLEFRLRMAEQRPTLPVGLEERLRSVEQRPTLPSGLDERIRGIEARQTVPVNLDDRLRELEASTTGTNARLALMAGLCGVVGTGIVEGLISVFAKH